MLILYLAAGGAAGTVARHAVSQWIGSHPAGSFLWATYAINVCGSLLIGFCIRIFQAADVATELKGFVIVGLLGGFTTFSTYTLEAVELIQDGKASLAVAYALGSMLTGLVAVLAGMFAAGLMTAR